MAIFHFRLGWPVLDAATHQLVTNRSDGQLFDENGVLVQATTPLGIPTRISTGPYGTTQDFNAPIEVGYVKFGNAEAPVYADETFKAAEKAAEALRIAQEAQSYVQANAAASTRVSYIRRTVDGRVYFTNYPVSEGGGQPIVRADGTAFIRFE